MKKTSLLSLLLVALLTAVDWAWMSTASAQTPPASGQRGGYAAQRERLVTGLQLDAGQQARLDAISHEMLPRVMALRGLAEAERAPARAKLMVEMQQKINAMLTPDQRAAYELMQATRDAAAAAAAKAPASAAAGS